MRRINLIALVIFLAGLVWVFTFDNPTTRKVQRSIGSLFSPFTRTGAKVQDAVSGNEEEAKSPDDLRRENAALKREVDEYRLQQQNLESLEKENAEMRSYMEFRKRYGIKLVAAEIISRKVSAWYREALIDKGMRHKVYEGTPVITPVLVNEGGVSRFEGALVGKVGAVEAESAKIVFVTDERCAVSATIKGLSHVHGILMGSRSSTKSVPDLRLRFIRPDGIELESGRQVLSEGLGGIFPSGILLGDVKSFQTGDINAEALVRPAVDFDNLRYVFVLQQEEAPAEPAPPTRKKP